MTMVAPPPNATDPSVTPPPEPKEPASGSAAVARLVAILAAIVVVALVTDGLIVVTVILALLGMIFVHELGHFVTARRAGMKVTEFFIGFGPRIWSFKRGETEYGVKAIPLGGYCRIIGMHNLEPVAPEDEARAYRQQPLPQRLAVAFGGPFMHALMAVALFFMLNTFVGNPLHRVQEPEIGGISALSTGESPAQQAGLEVGDRIVAVDGTELKEWVQLVDYVRTKAGVPLQLLVERGGSQIPITVTPTDLSKVEVIGRDGQPQKVTEEPRGFIGISAASRYEKVGVVPAVGRSVTDLGFVAKQVVLGIGKVFSFSGLNSYVDQVAGKEVAEEDRGNRFLSPIGVVQLASASAEQGLSEVLILFAIINMFVGILNLAPLPPFDGGHIVVALYEGIRSRLAGRRYFADYGKLLPVAYGVLMVMTLIAVSSIYLDLTNRIQLQ